MTRVTVRRIRAREVLDSRGNPTVAVEVELSDGTSGEAKIPSGASTGTHETVELRDGDLTRYGGKGVLKAVANVHSVLGPAVTGMNAENQSAIDGRLIETDGTSQKSRLGANAILGISCAVARAAANSLHVPLWKYLQHGSAASMPLPMVNIISGGLHAGHNIEFQDFLVIPKGVGDYPQALEAVVAVHRYTRQLLTQRGYLLTGIADEGGWGPRLPRNESALEILTEAIQQAGYDPGTQMAIAVDVAATHFYQSGTYCLRSEDRMLSSEGMVDLLHSWADRYPVISIEDGLAEDDWSGWRELTGKLGNRVQLVGDDLFVTNPQRLERGIRERAANAILVKMNQIGTLTETFTVIRSAREAGYRTVISARSGETEDDFLADLAVASSAGQIKIGSVRGSERLSKYNRLLKIHEELLGH